MLNNNNPEEMTLISWNQFFGIKTTYLVYDDHRENKIIKMEMLLPLPLLN